jgi:hypothetical protein
MAVCTWCEREMTAAATCTVSALHRHGARIDMIQWGAEPGWTVLSRCHDCGVTPGGFHHPGCDVQRCPTEFVRVGDQPAVIHYDDLPETDITTVSGVRCTTALRTVIDLALELDIVQLHRIVQDCLDRRLFTVEEAQARLAQPDMVEQAGAKLLRQVLP